MANLDKAEIEKYLKSIFGPSARLVNLKVLGKSAEQDVKGFGYGAPVQIDYECNGQQRRAVLHTVSPGPFGHEHMADRAGMLLWDHKEFNHLPRHVRSLDAGAFRPGGAMTSLGDAEEFFNLTEYAPGRCYAEDLSRLRDGGSTTDVDVMRADALCDYLVAVHRVKADKPGLYVRRIRELIGHSECIMGLIDSYPSDSEAVNAALLKNIERQCIDWRWRLKQRVHRLSEVHGDFHPWNILFNEDAEFLLLDRSRGEFGDPADDVTCLTMNYLFFSLQRFGRLEGDFEFLFQQFWKRYLENSGDDEILEVAAPFFAFRGLVMAHPIWYPHLSKDVREKLFNFIQSVLDSRVFDAHQVNNYCRMPG
jgi:phosphotransferase family enzyme